MQIHEPRHRLSGVIKPYQMTLIRCCIALMVTALLSQASVYQQISLWINDTQQALLAKPYYATDTLIINIDEDSLHKLTPYIGSWPYSRDIFALLTHYLHQAGAKSIVYDVLFSDAREGDEQFADALRQAGNVSLASVALPYPLTSSTGPDQMARHNWATNNIPAEKWAEVVLPRPELLASQYVETGIITASPDADGKVRQFSLLHRIHGTTMAALTLPPLFPNQRPQLQYDPDLRILTAGNYQWPLDAAGKATLYYPANTNNFLVMPFYRVMLDVLGAPGNQLDVNEFKGKTIFIGSTAAFFADSANTPRGQLPGVQLLALMHQNLLHNLLLAPPVPFWNALLLCLALAAPLIGAIRGAKTSLEIVAPMIMGMLLAWAGHLALLALLQQQAELLYPLLTLILFSLFQLAARLRRLTQERQQLITARKIAEEATRLKTQFLSTITHELRTPLTAIIGFNKLLGESETLTAQGGKYLATISANSEHLLALINNLLDNAKAEAGQMTIQHRSTDVSSLVNGVVETLIGLAHKKGITLAARFSGQIPKQLLLDPMRLRQILLNLTGNAIKFTAEGAVRLNVRWENGILEVTVIDTGPGISSENLPKIFDAFYQQQEGQGGTGLGLMISRNLAHLMGGNISVESVLGKGTQFHLKLLAEKVMERAVEKLSEPGQDSEAEIPPVKSPHKVLLVDDADDVRALMKIYISRMGYHVICASTGQQAIEMAFSEQPDLVLMDLEMPVMDGRNAVQTLRARGFTAPVLALTSHTVDTMREELLTLGFTDGLTKTADYSTISSTLENMLTRTTTYE